MPTCSAWNCGPYVGIPARPSVPRLSQRSESARSTIGPTPPASSRSTHRRAGSHSPVAYDDAYRTWRDLGDAVTPISHAWR